LGQWKQTDSLHWFESVERSLAKERQEVESQKAAEKDEKLQNTQTLTLRRLETTLREFQLLHFGVNAARIFFQVRYINVGRYTLFFIRTKFIRTLSLNFGEILRTFLTLKLTRFLIVLKLKY